MHAPTFPKTSGLLFPNRKFRQFTAEDSFPEVQGSCVETLEVMRIQSNEMTSHRARQVLAVYVCAPRSVIGSLLYF
jgi:hypothetical protein